MLKMLYLLLILIVMILFFPSVIAQSLSNNKIYSTQIDTIKDDDGLYNSIIYTDENRNVLEDGEWVRKEEAKSLKEVYDWQTQLDLNYPILINDFNLTHLDLCLQSNTYELNIPLRVYHYDKVNIAQYFLQNEKEVSECMNLNDDINNCINSTPKKVIDIEIDIPMLSKQVCTKLDVSNIFNRYISWGSSSTIIFMNFTTFNQDGYISFFGFGSTWPFVHNIASGTADSTSNFATVNSFGVGGFGWQISRGFFPINMADIPENIIITDATFKFHVNNINTPSYYSLVNTTQGNTLDNDDFDQCGNVLIPAIAGASNIFIDSTGWNEFQLNETGLSWIKDETTYLGVREMHDANDTQPTDATPNYLMSVSTKENTTHSPFLNITYYFKPVIRLNSPLNQTINFSKVNFDISVNVGGFNVSNITLYSDYNGSWGQIDTLNVDWQDSTSNTASFQRNITDELNYTNTNFLDDGFKWNVLARTVNGEMFWSFNNESFSNFDINSSKENISTLNSDVRIRTAEFSDDLYNMDGNVLLYHMNRETDRGENNTFAIDFSGSGNNLILDIDTEFEQQGKLEGAYNFDHNEEGNITNDNNLNIQDHFTILTWFKLNEKMVADGGIRTLLSKTSTPFVVNYNLAIQDLKLRGVFTSSIFVFHIIRYDISFIDQNEWHHAVMRWNTSTDNFSLFFDGVNVNSTVFAGVNPQPLGNISFIASSGGGSYLKGSMDEIAIFNRSLSDDEILDIFTRQNRTYRDSGLYQSKIFTNGSIVNYTMEFNKTENNQELLLYTRTTNDSSCNSFGDWQEILSPFNIGFSRCIQYQANLSGNNFSTPILNWVNLSYPKLVVGGTPLCDEYTGGNYNLVEDDVCVVTQDNADLEGNNFSCTGGGTIVLERNITNAKYSFIDDCLLICNGVNCVYGEP